MTNKIKMYKLYTLSQDGYKQLKPSIAYECKKEEVYFLKNELSGYYITLPIQITKDRCLTQRDISIFLITYNDIFHTKIDVEKEIQYI